MGELITMPFSLPEALRQAARRSPRRGIRLLDRREEVCWLDYGEVVDRAERAAHALAVRGVAPADRIGIFCPTSTDFLDALLGALTLGAVPVPLYPPVRLGRMEAWIERSAAMLRDAGAVGIVADRRTRRVLGAVVEQVVLACGVIAAEELAQSPPMADPPRLDPDSLALVQFSSGTTRRPAPVALTHRQILANVHAILEMMPEPAFDRGGCACWLPLYHDMGLIGCLLASIVAAETITLIPPELFLARPGIWLRAIGRFDATVSTAPNFAYGRCVEKIGDQEMSHTDLSSWMVALNGAEPIAAETMRAFIDRFSPYGFDPAAMTPVYGLSEAALAVTFSPRDRPFQARRFDRHALGRGEAVVTSDAGGVELTSVGSPLRGYEVMIGDGPNEGRETGGEGRVGRILVRGPSVTSGYLDGREGPVGDDGWLDTGDTGFFHEGQLFVCGRAKDVVIVRGRNHPPQELERACDEVPGVRTGCSVAVSDLEAGRERVIVFVERRDEAPGQAKACRDAIRARSGVAPDLVVLLAPGTLPRTSSGKLRRAETLRQWKAGELVPPDDVGAVELAGHMARSLIGYLRAW